MKCPSVQYSTAVCLEGLKQFYELILVKFLTFFVVYIKSAALILHHDRRQHYKLTTGFLATLQIFCAVLIILNFLLWSEATLKEAAVVWFCTAFLFLIGACAGFIHSVSIALGLTKTSSEVVVVACGDVNTKTSKSLRLKSFNSQNLAGKKKELGRDEEKREAGSSEDEVPPQEVQANRYPAESLRSLQVFFSNNENTPTDKSTRNTTDRQSSLQDTQTRHRPKRKDEKRGKNDLTETGDVDTLAEGYSSGYRSESSEDPEENMIPAYGSGNTRTEFRHSPRSPYITAGFSNENRITDRGTKSKTKKKKKNDTIAIDDMVAIVLSSLNKSGSSEHSEELEHSTGASYVASASYHRGPRTKRNQIIGKEPPHLSSPRKPKTDNKWKKLPAKESQNQLIQSPHKSLGQHGSTSLLTPEEQNQRNEEEEEASRDNIGRNIGRNNDDVIKQLDISSSGRIEASIETLKPVELLPSRTIRIQHQMKQLKGLHQAHLEDRRLAEEEAKRLAEERARWLAAEEARRIAEEEARRRLAEEEARRLAEEAKRLAEERARQLAAEEARRLAEERARRLAEEEARRLAVEEAARRLAEEKAAKLAQEKADKLAQEKAAKLAQERAAKLVEEKAAKLAEEEAAKLAQEKAAKLAEERAAKLAEEEAAKLAQEKAAKLAEERAAKLVEERAAKLVEEKAAKLAEEKAAKLAEERAAKLVEERAAKLVEERAAKLADERAAKLVEEKAAKLVEERATKLVEERAAKLAEEEAAKLAEEKAAKLVEEKAAKLAEERAAKLA
ncbi:hypothetical protein BSL78_28486 [Apostichopus japonicus]|uniref:Uncharacterized protein n=1 Tax=Stichopus japonicus TaxID=307972 RepID=A0A2G8JG51_STIJA|nr:hypothetical protein BSL78_28486 [Apostichopus japonicus]